MLHDKKAIKDSEPLVLFSESGAPAQDKEANLVTVSRGAAHKFGSLHMTANVLFVHHDRAIAGDAQVILQKRASNKPIFPGAWTVSCGGHADTELKPKEVACREAQEEFGLIIDKERLIPVPDNGRPLENFLKVWKLGARVYSQLDITAQTIQMPRGDLSQPSLDRDIVAHLRAIPPSSLGEQGHLPLYLDTFNRELCYYFLCKLTRTEVESIAFTDGEAEGKQIIPVGDFVRDAPFMTDSSFTLVRGVPDIQSKVEEL